MKYEIENGMYIVDGEKLTPEEFEESYATCSCCGSVFLKDEGCFTEDTRKWFCNDCSDEVYTCDGCGAYIEEPLQHSDSDYCYCGSCYHRYTYYVCEECGREFRYSESGNYDDYDYWYCHNCIDKGYGDFGSRYIDEYHDFKDSGRILFYGTEDRRKEPYMGYELEIDGGSSNRRGKVAENIHDEFDDFFHCEYDGSLNSGFEIISQPASISYHLATMPRYKNMFNAIIGEGFSSHNAGTCGLHIHIDRAYFEDKEDSSIAKLLYIFEKHWTNLKRFSRRKESQMEWCDRYGGKPTEIVKQRKRGLGYGRYYAVNLSNSNTIEIRLWRGSLNPLTFEATLKFTARLAEICKTKSAVEISRMSFEALLGDDETIKAYWETVKNREV